MLNVGMGRAPLSITILAIKDDMMRLELESRYNTERFERLEDSRTDAYTNNIILMEYLMNNVRKQKRNNESALLYEESISFIDEIIETSMVNVTTKSMQPRLHGEVGIVLARYDKVGVPIAEAINEWGFSLDVLCDKLLGAVRYLASLNVFLFEITTETVTLAYKNGEWRPILMFLGYNACLMNNRNGNGKNSLLSIPFFLNKPRGKICLVGKPLEIWVMYEMVLNNHKYLTGSILDNVINRYDGMIDEMGMNIMLKDDLEFGVRDDLYGAINKPMREVITMFCSKKYSHNWGEYGVKFMIEYIKLQV
jgi:hypothetical protein